MKPYDRVGRLVVFEVFDRYVFENVGGRSEDGPVIATVDRPAEQSYHRYRHAIPIDVLEVNEEGDGTTMVRAIGTSSRWYQVEDRFDVVMQRLALTFATDLDRVRQKFEEASVALDAAQGG